MAGSILQPEPKSGLGKKTPLPLTWRLIRPDGRPKEVVVFEETVVEFFLDAAVILGFPKSLAAIYGIIFASPVPLSFSEVQERLNISAGSISQGLRVLREVSALKVVPVLAGKREFFEPDLELRKLAARYLEQRVGKQLGAGQNQLLAMGRAIPDGPNDSDKILRARLKSLQSWHDKSRRLLPMISAILKLTS